MSLMGRGPASLKVLFRRKKTSIEVMSQHWYSAISHKLRNGVILLIETIKNKVVELLMTKRLNNRGQCISKGIDGVVVDRHGLAKFLRLGELSADLRGTGIGLRSKGAIDDGPGFSRRGRKYNHGIDRWRRGRVQG
jgi:hypothetical protein